MIRASYIVETRVLEPPYFWAMYKANLDDTMRAKVTAAYMKGKWHLVLNAIDNIVEAVQDGKEFWPESKRSTGEIR